MLKSSGSHKGQVSGLLSPFLERTRLRKIASTIADGVEILDVGCGTCSILSYINTPARYVGVDILEEVIGYNKKRFPNWEFFKMDVEKEAVPAWISGFDAVILGAVTEHFHDQARTLETLATYLKKSGRIVLTTPSPKGATLLKVGANVRVFSPEAEAEHNTLLDRPRIERLATESGLKVLIYKKFLIGFNQLAVLTRM